MACQTPDHPDPSVSYRSLSSFYLADPRRIGSHERDLGLWWRVGRHGPSYRAAWVRDTGELYAARLGLPKEQGEVHVLGHANDEELEEALEGWADVCPQPDSMTWLRRRATSLTQPQAPRAGSRARRELAVRRTSPVTALRRRANAKVLALVGATAGVTAPTTALLLELSAA